VKSAALPTEKRMQEARQKKLHLARIVCNGLTMAHMRIVVKGHSRGQPSLAFASARHRLISGVWGKNPVGDGPRRNEVHKRRLMASK